MKCAENTTNYRMKMEQTEKGNPEIQIHTIRTCQLMMNTFNSPKIKKVKKQKFTRKRLTLYTTVPSYFTSIYNMDQYMLHLG